MHKSGSSKYLQLPASDPSDIGKPSPLAMLAATCQRIGAPSPARPARQHRSPTPVARPVPESSPVAALSPHPSPVELPQSQKPSADHAASRVTNVPPSPLQVTTGSAVSPAYRLPLTPPCTPPSDNGTSTPPPRAPSNPKPTSSPVALELPACHIGLPPHHQPVLHAPSLRYSPYTVIVPSSRHMSPYGGCVNQCCSPHAPALPCSSLAVPPVYFAGAAPFVLPTQIAATSPVHHFGTYLHHDVSVSSQCESLRKIRTRPSLNKPAVRQSTPYDITRLLKKHELDEEVIDVVSV